MLYPLLGFPPKDGCKETSFLHTKQIRHIVGRNNCQNTICSFRMRFHSQVGWLGMTCPHESEKLKAKPKAKVESHALGRKGTLIGKD